MRSETTYDIAWLAWRLKALDSLLSKIGFVSVPFLDAENKYDSFPHVAGALFPNVSSVCSSSEIRLTTLYNTAHIVALQHHDH